MLHSIHGALTQHCPLMQHRHLLGGLPDEFHIVLDYQDGVILRHALQQLGCRLAFLAGHARNRLIEQQQGRILGHHHADLQPLGLPMGQRPRLVMRFFKQAEGFQNGADPVRLRCGQRAEQRRPEIPALGEGKQEIFK